MTVGRAKFGVSSVVNERSGDRSVRDPKKFEVSPIYLSQVDQDEFTFLCHNQRLVLFGAEF